MELEAQDIEIMMGLLTPRGSGAASVARAPGRYQAAGARESAPIMSLVRRARDEFERRRAVGDGVASAIMTLTAAEWDDGGSAGIQVVLARQGADRALDADEAAPLIHDCAVDGFKTGHASRAAVLFATLLHLGTEPAEALSGLALCAARLGKFEQALTLATECLKLPVKHPRAYCIAGYCELERGNRKAAQSLLALGARIARNRPEFVEDLRAAQRVLLVMHFA